MKELNYNKNDTSFATGLVKPKTTSLLFDKIWVPLDLRTSTYGFFMGFHDIPPNILLVEPVEEKFGGAYDSDLLNCIMLNRPSYTVEADIVNLNFLYSASRNRGIATAAMGFKKLYDIDMTPVYFNKTQYELEHTGNKYETYQDELIHCLTLNKATNEQNKMLLKSNSIAFCIEGIPEIIDEKLNWEQVQDIRNDKESIKKLKRFKYWMLGLNGKSSDELQANICKALDDYTFAMKKHGVLMTTGGITTVVSAGSTTINSLSHDTLDIIMMGITVATGITAFTIKEAVNYCEAKRAPIAFLYDILNR